MIGMDRHGFIDKAQGAIICIFCLLIIILSPIIIMFNGINDAYGRKRNKARPRGRAQ